MNITDAMTSAESIITTLKSQRCDTKFVDEWEKTNKLAKNLSLSKAKLPMQIRRATRRIDEGSVAVVFEDCFIVITELRPGLLSWTLSLAK